MTDKQIEVYTKALEDTIVDLKKDYDYLLKQGQKQSTLNMVDGRITATSKALAIFKRVVNEIKE